MKGTQIIFFTLTLINQAIGQDIDSLERKLSSKQLTSIDRIETLNLISKGLTFVNPIKALDNANKALELSIVTNNSVGEAYAYRNLANIYSFNESYLVSMEYLQKAMDIFTLNNDSIGIANCYVSLGLIYNRLQNRNEELNYNLKAYKIFKRLNNRERIGVTAHNLGESYLAIGDLINSRQLTLYAIKINDSLDNKVVLSSCYKAMGMIELAEKNLASAESYFKKSIDIETQLDENSQKVVAAESMIQLSTVYKLTGDLDNQFKLLVMASKVSTKHNLPNHLQRIYQELVLYSSRKNDQVAVRRYINIYSTLSDSLNQKLLRDRYRLTKNAIQFHEMSKSKAELKKMNLLQSQKIQKRNTLIIVIVLSSIILLWALLKFIWLNRKLKRQNLIIKMQKSDLEVLNSTKDKFFSIVAHDMKSPLNSLKSFSSILIDHFDHLNKDEILTTGRQLRDSVDNTIKMADNLITWAMVQRKGCQFNEETLRVTEIASNVYDVYQNVALSKGISMSCSVEDSLTVTGDKNQIEFIIRNLVSNAIKFTHRDGFVALTAKSLPEGRVQISVSDSGVGISDDIKSKLFTIGNKQSTNGTVGEKGTGLGLMLCYEFLKLNGGQIDIESSLGKGTTFHTKFKSGH